MLTPIREEKILFHGGEILDPARANSVRQNLVVIDGKIADLGDFDPESFSGLKVSVAHKLITPGLIDMHVHLREPGYEYKETIATGCDAAMAGGFTAVACMPNTSPAIDKQEVVNFIHSRARNLLVDVLPVGAITKDRSGAEITEMGELVAAGVVAFSDDGSPVKNPLIMRRAMEYVSMFDKCLIEHCEDPDLAAGGAMNESFVSTTLGIPGMPTIAEDVMVARNIILAQYTGCRLHIAHISTAASVQLVRQAKQAGLPVTCEATPHHFILTDEALVNYDTNLKMNPPLRAEADRQAILQGLVDGTIDVIASDHAPHASDEKDVEFDTAPFGIIGLETTLGLVLSQLVTPGKLTLSEAIAKLSLAPAKVLGIHYPGIQKGAPANFTIFDPRAKWKYNRNQTHSKSSNTPFHGWQMTGKVSGVFNRGLWCPIV